MIEDTLTKKQKALIAFCKAHGYGWSKFASSVESQGRCSPKQEATLIRMKQRLEAHEIMARRLYLPKDYDSISDEEAAMSGDYF